MDSSDARKGSFCEILGDMILWLECGIFGEYSMSRIAKRLCEVTKKVS